LTIGVKLGSLGALQKGIAEVLDQSANAVLFLDEHRRIAYANAPAQAMHRAGDGLLLRDGAMLLHRRDDDRLQSLIAEVIAATRIDSPAAGGTMRAARLSGKRPYLIVVTPVATCPTALAPLKPVVCLVVIDPEERPRIPIDRIRSAFGLTQAEARLAARLADGEDLRTAASALGITYGTARARLGIVFQKTDTRRQGELIRLVLTAGSAR
jgi:DNA-binding CsgD family transcriptional regulator